MNKHIFHREHGVLHTIYDPEFGVVSRLCARATYFVSVTGNVFSLRHGRLTKLKFDHNSCGYPRVKINIGEGRKHYFVHRLVAEHFKPNPDAYPIVDHIDCDINNNCADNLMWVKSQKEHMRLHRDRRYEKAVQMSKIDCPF